MENKDMIPFILSEELVKILFKMQEDGDEIATNIIETTKHKDISYVGLAESPIGNLSYLNRKKMEGLFAEEYWNPKRRWGASPSKFVSTIFPNIYNDHTKQLFTVKLKAFIGMKNESSEFIKVVEGDDIAKYYYVDNYETSVEGYSGSNLYNSCMKYDSCQKYFDLYTKNPNQVKMAVIVNSEGLLKSRCIIWYGQNKHEGKVFFDRIYGNCYSIENQMHLAMESKGWINISDKNEIKPKSEFEISIKLDIGESKISEYPYVDTLYWISGDTIYNNINAKGFKMQKTDGSYQGDDGTTICDNCSNRVNEDEVYQIHTDSNSSGEIQCNNCCQYSEYHDGYFEKEELLYSGCMISFIKEEVSIKLYDGDFVVESESLELHNGVYAWVNDNDLMCSEEDEYFLKGDSNFEKIEGQYYRIGSELHREVIKSLELV